MISWSTYITCSRREQPAKQCFAAISNLILMLTFHCASFLQLTARANQCLGMFNALSSFIATRPHFHSVFV